MTLSVNPNYVQPSSLQPIEPKQAPSYLSIFNDLTRDLLQLQLTIKRIASDKTTRMEMRYTRCSDELASKIDWKAKLGAGIQVAGLSLQALAAGLRMYGLVSRQQQNLISSVSSVASNSSPLFTAKLEAQVSKLQYLLNELNTQMANNNGQADNSIKDQILQTLQQMQDLMRAVSR